MKNDNKTRIILNILKIGVYLDGITTYIALSQGRQEINGIFYLIYHFAKHIFPAILIWIISVLLTFYALHLFPDNIYEKNIVANFFLDKFWLLGIFLKALIMDIPLIYFSLS